jgi:hypothetical protein
MTRPAVLVALVVAVTLGPAARPASAEDAGPEVAPANVESVEMLVDARVNGKDDWSPGGRELQWQVSKCPFKIQFKGEVNVDKPTKITYRWERSDGEHGPVQTFDVKTAGQLVEVTPPDVWNVGKAGQTFRGAATFHVMTPGDMSTTTPVRVECQ